MPQKSIRPALNEALAQAMRRDLAIGFPADPRHGRPAVGA